MLALAIGGCTVAELQQRMGAGEFAAWLAFYQVEPFGEVRADLRAALGATLTANAHRNAKKRKRPFEIGDFLFEFWKQERPAAPTSGVMMAKFRALTSDLVHVVSNGESDGD